MKKLVDVLMGTIEKAEKYFITAGLIIISLLVFVQVVLRYVFNTGILGSDEMARFIFVFITWIGASLSVKEGEHIKITILSDLLWTEIWENCTSKRPMKSVWKCCRSRIPDLVSLQIM